MHIDFANVILEPERRCVQHPLLYCRASEPFFFDAEKDAWCLAGAAVFDFTTYFNSLSIKKLKALTIATSFSLHLEVSGSGCTVLPTHVGPLGGNPVFTKRQAVDAAASDDWQNIEMRLAIPDTAVLASFAIDAKGPVWVRNARFVAEIPDGALRPVELAVAMTTFKKEHFVERNVGIIRRDILDAGHELGRHLHIHIVDNGRTLSADRLATERISIHPNPNVGGSGGFARGMIEAMRQNVPATHVLLMDDDVEISCESLSRTFNLLRIVKDDYAEAFVGGAMMSLEKADRQHEDLGFMGTDGLCHQLKKPSSMEEIDRIVASELVDTTQTDPQTYMAWWYCCIPLSVVRSRGLPMPLFVRYDDVEYGLRCRPKFITMNGICVWHMPFDIRYNAVVERYQTTRNALIIQALGRAPASNFTGKIARDIDLELKKLNYASAELVLDGFEDFLAGPSCISEPNGEAIMRREGEKAEKPTPLDKLAQQEGVWGEAARSASLAALEQDPSRSLVSRLLSLLTVNGHRFKFLCRPLDDPAVITTQGWVYPAGAVNRRTKLLAVDARGQNAVMRTINIGRYRTIIKRYKKDLRLYRARKRELERAYREACDHMTSTDFWKRYLGIE